MPYDDETNHLRISSCPTGSWGAQYAGRVLERLAETKGYSGNELEADAGHALAVEMLRALKAMNAVELGPGTRVRYRLSRKSPIGKALRELTQALGPLSGAEVSRPPSRRH